MIESIKMWINLYTIQNEMLLSPIIVQGVLVFLISILFIYKAKQEENKDLKTLKQNPEMLY